MNPNTISCIFYEAYGLLLAMSPYLLFGFLVAGALHVFFDASCVARHLGRSSVVSVVKAALFGIPLPLCSCGVIPTAIALKKEGASKGSILSFLISTPTTGVDSILATYALLGGLFTVYRVAASFLAGVLAGILANVFLRGDSHATAPVSEPCCRIYSSGKERVQDIFDKIREMFQYAFVGLVSDVGRWLIIGIFAGAVITYFVPGSLIVKYSGNGLVSMVVMLLVGIPMYVCATGSIPIAAALMMKGLNPGAAFVFLVAGPATNAVTMTVVANHLGKKALLIYLFSIVVSSLSMGMLLDKIWYYFTAHGAFRSMIISRAMMPPEIEKISSIVLLVLILFGILRTGRSTQ